jgi:DNA-binding NarL/FixJ family response regulator
MIVMLIEDNQLKADRITGFLSEAFDVVDTPLYRSYQSGLKAALTDTPDLILLDMTLPTFDAEPGKREGRPRSMGGRELMRKLSRRNVSTKIIVVSQFISFGEGTDAITFDELMSLCQQEFPESFCGGVYYHATSDEWMTELERLIKGLGR